MEVLTFLVLFLALLGFVVGLIGLIFKGFRPKAKKIAGGSFVLVLVSGIYGGTKLDDWARSKGFNSSADQSAAREAGVSDPAEWAEKRAIIEREAQAKKEADAQLAAQREASAKTAGFDSYAQQQDAKSEGVATAQEWRTRLAGKERDARLDRLKATKKSIQFVEEMGSGDTLNLFIRVKTAGLDGGKLDFYDFSQTVSEVAAQLRKETTKYASIQVRMIVPTLDKYGNSDTTPGGDIYWKMSELDKVNLSAGPEFVLKVADKVSLGRFGAEMAQKYCAEHEDFRDRRYCR